MQAFVRVLVAAIHPGRGRASEWLSALTLTCWGLVLLEDGRTFDFPSYRGIRLYADESTWAWICLCVGLVGLAALAVNGRLPQGSPILRAACSAFRVIFWGNIAFGFAYAAITNDAFSTALAVYPWLMVFDTVACYRATRDARAGGHPPGWANPQTAKQRLVVA